MWESGSQTPLTPTKQDTDAGVAHLRRRREPALPTPNAPQASKREKERKKDREKERKIYREKERKTEGEK